MRNGILYHTNEDSGSKVAPTEIPCNWYFQKTFRKQALQGCHDDLGHLGIEWTIDQRPVLLAHNDGRYS